MTRFKSLLVTALLALPKLALCTHPGVDLTFGNAGIASAVTSNINLSYSDRRYGSTTRISAPNGQWYVFAHDQARFTIARFAANGRLDTSFASEGVYQDSFAKGVPAGKLLMLLDENQKPIIVSGTLDEPTTIFNAILQLRRLTVAGVPDASFGINGSLTIALPSATDNNGVGPSTPTSLYPRNGGGLFVVMGGGSVVAVNETGGVDSAFYDQGIFSKPNRVFGSYSYGDQIVAVSAEGAIYSVIQTATGPNLIRYVSNGALDTLYRDLSIGSASWTGFGATLSPDGALFLTFTPEGYTFFSTLRILKIDRLGTIDSTFGTQGVLDVPHQDYPFYSTRLASVGRDGSLLTVTEVRSQLFKSPVQIRRFDKNGQIAAEFGGKGATRIEPTPIDSRWFYAVNAQFDDENRVTVLGVDANSTDALRVIRLSQNFQHRATLTDPTISGNVAGVIAPKSEFVYGEPVAGNALLVGDSGAAGGFVRFQLGSKSCDSDYISYTHFPAQRAGCGKVWSEAIGTLPWALSYEGDDIYPPSRYEGGEVHIQKRKLFEYRNPYAPQTVTARVGEPVTFSVNWSDGATSSPNDWSPLSGTTEFATAGGSCRTSMPTSSNPRCPVRPLQTGTFPITVTYGDDRYYTSDPVTLGSITVLPINTSVTLALEADKSVQVTIEASDPLCGLQYGTSYDLGTQLNSLPRPNSTTVAKNRNIYFATYPGCATGASLSVTLTFSFPIGQRAELWSADYGGGSIEQVTWLQVPTTVDGRTMKINVKDDGVFDLLRGEPGAILANLVLYATPNPNDEDEDGIPNAGEIAEGRDPTKKDNAIFAGMHPNSNRWFAMQQYRDFLGREADAAGLADWTNLLATGAMSRETVIQGFFGSPEFQSGVPSVVRLYLGFFKRIPDSAGLKGWVGAVRGGTSLAAVASAFAQSPEFQLTYGALNDTQFVTLVYQNVLGRAPDTAGFNGWLSRLQTGMSRGEMMVGFTESAEFQAQTRNNVFVIMMYEGMLRRAAEQGGYEFWVNYANSGKDALDLTRGFLNSAEYRNRFLSAL